MHTVDMAQNGEITNRKYPMILRWTAGVCLGLLLSFLALPTVERVFLERAGAQGEATLRIVVEGLDATLERFEPIPKLLAERPSLIGLLNDPTNQGLLPFVNEQLRLTAMSLGVSDVYIMDIGGTTIAASSYRKELSFVGRNFNFRPYFVQAVEGGLGQYFAMGTTSGERGYFFAAPVIDNTRIIGVVAIKFDVSQFEKAWSGGGSDIVVTDLSDIVFMSNRDDWHFKTLTPLRGEVFNLVAETRQYPLDRLLPLAVEQSPINERFDLMTIEQEGFILSAQTLPDVGWKVLHLTPAGPARTQAIFVLSLVALLVLLTVLSAAIILQRRNRTRERIEEQARANEVLEQRVLQRTSALNEANTQLQKEVTERTATEQRLRNTQKELIQAGKLAALGQMSAALSHEINQPLTAVKAYADNAATFLDRNRVGDARDNVARISKMADRMASLSGHLRNFARRPQDTIGPVDILLVLDDAIELMGTRLRAAAATINYTPPDAALWVNGGRLRLQQVFVNILSNALDAMNNSEETEIEIRIENVSDTRLRVTVADRGTGITNEIINQLFDPFFTTKEPGHGLGLGLSISFNIVEDFGGRLWAEPREDGGAKFMVELERTEKASDGKELAAE
ncbi:MAG: sensor histidine kinase [Boseongicola sp.]|nr:sensor histidine kinase [Boseongicola sp.]